MYINLYQKSICIKKFILFIPKELQVLLFLIKYDGTLREVKTDGDPRNILSNSNLEQILSDIKNTEFIGEEEPRSVSASEIEVSNTKEKQMKNELENKI